MPDYYKNFDSMRPWPKDRRSIFHWFECPFQTGGVCDCEPLKGLTDKSRPEVEAAMAQEEVEYKAKMEGSISPASVNERTSGS